MDGFRSHLGSGAIEAEANHCRKLIESLEIAAQLTRLSNVENIIRHLNYALSEAERGLALLPLGYPVFASTQAMKNYTNQAKNLWGKALTNGRADKDMIRVLYQQMIDVPNNFTKVQIEAIRFLINWFDDQGEGHGFAFQ